MYALNHVPLIDISKSTTGCCTLINPSDWDEQEFVFEDKPFVKARTRSFLHVPLNMNAVMKRAQAKIDDADARSDESIILSYEASPWHADHFFSVSKNVPDMEIVELSGHYMTKVFEGPYKDARKWYDQLIDYVTSKGKKPLKTYFFYTTCPNCAKAYGKNYVVGFAETE